MRGRFFLLTFLLIILLFSQLWCSPLWIHLTLPRSPVDFALAGSIPMAWSNPAAVSDKVFQVSTGYSTRFGDESENYAFVSYKWRDNIGVFARANFNTVSNIEARIYPTDCPDYYFSAQSSDFMLGASYHISEFVWIGASTKYVYESLEFEKVEGYAFALGASVQKGKFNYAVSIDNIGKSQRFIEYYYPMPTVLRLWAGYESDFYRIGVSYSNFSDLPDYSSVGLTVTPVQWISLHAGYVIHHDTRSFSVGTSIKWTRLAVDYSIAAFGELGYAHNFGISYCYIQPD